FAEGHDVDALLAEGRADGRGRIGLAPWDLQLNLSNNFLCHKNFPWAQLPIQAFSTCQYSNSTGVLRPKMLTVTLSLPRSGSISSITPLKFRKGPSLILMVSPTSKFTLGFSVSSDSEMVALMTAI